MHMNRRSAEEKGGGLKMNWSWPSRSGTVLTDNATSADNRLKAIKRVSIRPQRPCFFKS